ncbi:MAG: hypothetical protein V1866_01515 [archaeon]
MDRRIILTTILAFLLVLPAVSGDGGFFIRDRDMWSLFPEKQQYCAINHKDGVQRMILTIDTNEELRGDKAVWIFPVPAPPKTVRINITGGFPLLTGYDLADRADDQINTAYIGMAATQLYTFPFIAFFSIFSSRGLFSAGGSNSLGADSLRNDVEVYASMQKAGLTTELVSAKDSDAFKVYMTKNNLSLPIYFTSILDYYTGNDYSLVVSWISNVSRFREAQQIDESPYFYRPRSGSTVGVFISFPTEKIYYPLKPTSVYGDNVVPAIIYVLDYVQPELYDGIRWDTQIDYFYSTSTSASDDLTEFYKGYRTINLEGGAKLVENINYTKIKINATASSLTDDLWINKTTPKKVVVLTSIIGHSFLWGLIIFLIISMFSSMIAGAIIFRGERPSIFKFFFFGFSNLFSLAGFWLLSYLMGIERLFTDKEGDVRQDVSLTKGQNAAIMTPIILLGVSAILIPLALLLDLEILYFPMIISPIFIIFGIPILGFLPLILFGVFKRKKVLFFNLVFAGTFMLLLLLSRLLLSIII